MDASIYLLGRDIREIFRDETSAQLKNLLAKLQPSTEEDSDSLESQLAILELGIDGVISE
ncbi:MAG: hypothetical protein SW833_07515 [Cyanobacteriota bacterium]|nr:hypothetical protein [Cyanobacteriota bacterium]